MSQGYKHSTKWSFGDTVWHRVTHDKGMIMGINLYPNSSPKYLIVFEDSRNDVSCLEFELTDEQPSPVEGTK